ncbi:MAG TPA: hypothetical protein VIA06_18425 [Candidatus Dormibacteraeota bacterium]|nr:hypothetical protein [Candidatus Dormibacteraeota bacterium]
MDDEPSEIELIDEGGQPHSFLVHDAVEVDGQTCYLVESVDDEDLVLVLRERDGNLEALAGGELDLVIQLLGQDS